MISSKILFATFMGVGSLGLTAGVTVVPSIAKAVKRYELQSLKIGAFQYRVNFSKDSLGEVEFPKSDVDGQRVIVLPDKALGQSQYGLSLMHEELHACFHDHVHDYATNAELKDHLINTRYSEDDVVEMLAPCLVDLRKK
jgi:hypothetical protein